MKLARSGSRSPILSGQDRLAEDPAVERMSVHRYLKELKEKGAIRIARRGAMKTNIHTIVKPSDASFLRHHDVTASEHHDVTRMEH